MLDIPPDRRAEGGGEVGMSDAVELKPCAKCGGEAKQCVGRDGNRRNRHLVYGYCCSNKDCSWSYAWTAHSSLKEAADSWNKKVDAAEYLKSESKKLLPCICGGKANLVFERYEGAFGLWFVRCESCQRLQTGVASKDNAIEAWNRRANDG